MLLRLFLFVFSSLLYDMHMITTYLSFFLFVSSAHHRHVVNLHHHRKQQTPVHRGTEHVDAVRVSPLRPHRVGELVGRQRQEEHHKRVQDCLEHPLRHYLLCGV